MYVFNNKESNNMVKYKHGCMSFLLAQLKNKNKFIGQDRKPSRKNLSIEKITLDSAAEHMKELHLLP